jgi:hypothetical protein
MLEPFEVFLNTFPEVRLIRFANNQKSDLHDSSIQKSPAGAGLSNLSRNVLSVLIFTDDV